ncbi:unnamed protein product [Scytosiphon promiscuus]
MTLFRVFVHVPGLFMKDRACALPWLALVASTRALVVVVVVVVMHPVIDHGDGFVGPTSSPLSIIWGFLRQCVYSRFPSSVEYSVATAGMERRPQLRRLAVPAPDSPISQPLERASFGYMYASTMPVRELFSSCRCTCQCLCVIPVLSALPQAHVPVWRLLLGRFFAFVPIVSFDALPSSTCNSLSAVSLHEQGLRFFRLRSLQSLPHLPTIFLCARTTGLGRFSVLVVVRARGMICCLVSPADAWLGANAYARALQARLCLYHDTAERTRSERLFVNVCCGVASCTVVYCGRVGLCLWCR